MRALRALVEWQIAEGIDFLVPCGSTGEAQTLDDGERERVVATVVETAAGRVQVMAGATSNDTARAVEEARRMCALGADSILSATPYYNRPAQEGLYRHFPAIADASTRPVCLYNVPGRTAVNLAAGHRAPSRRAPNVMGIKEASGDLRQIMEISGPAGGLRGALGRRLARACRSPRWAATASSRSPRTRCPRAMTELVRRRCAQGDLEPRARARTGCCR